jgi:molybdopterin molybdotransferase
MKKMISIGEAKALLAQHTSRLGAETVPLIEAIGRISAAPVVAPLDMPSFDNAAMDGYALAWQEGVNRYRLTGEIAAGDGQSYRLEPGTAMRIFTGAPVPEGADTVVQQEWSSREGEFVVLEGDIRRGMHIRLRGAQCREGDCILPAGSEITAGTMALLASVGLTEITVYRKPRVNVLVTGNEIVAAGTPLPPGAVYNTNGPFLQAYLERLGCTVNVNGPVADQPGILQEAVNRALQDCDMLVLTGGISVGEYDFVQSSLLNAGAETWFYKLKQKPGKPIWAGRAGEVTVFALPGNPASVIACANQYVKPVLRRMAGFEHVFEPDALLPLRAPFSKKAGLAHILKAKVAQGKVEVLPGQESFNLLAFADCNAFVVLPEDAETVDAGALVPVYYW